MKGETNFKAVPSALPVKQEYDEDLQPDILTKSSNSVDIKLHDLTFLTSIELKSEELSVFMTSENKKEDVLKFPTSEDKKPDASTVSFFDNQDGLKVMTNYSLSSSAVIEKLSVLIYKDFKEPKSMCTKAIDILSSNDQLINENGKKYKCDMCNQKLMCLDHITQHIKIHTGETQTESVLSVHNKCRSQEGHHECDVCHRMFAMKTNLIKHTKVHAEPKQIKCDLCNKKINLINKTHKCCHYPEMYSNLSKLKTLIKIHNLTENKNVHSVYKKA